MVYNGNKPYIFISYSSLDKKIVKPIIKRLEEYGFRVWYDRGISGGADIFDTLARKIVGSGVVVSLMTNNSANSVYCQKEIKFAISEKVNILVCQLEEVTLTPGMKFLLQDLEAIKSYELDDEDEFYEYLTESEVLQCCRGDEEPVAAQTVAPTAETPATVQPVVSGTDSLYPQPLPTAPKEIEVTAEETQEDPQEEKASANAGEEVSTEDLVKRISAILPSFIEKEKGTGFTETTALTTNDKAEETEETEEAVSEETATEETPVEETPVEETPDPKKEETSELPKAPEDNADLLSRLSALLEQTKISTEPSQEETTDEDDKQEDEIEDTAPSTVIAEESAVDEATQDPPSIPEEEPKKAESKEEPKEDKAAEEAKQEALLSRLNALLADKDD